MTAIATREELFTALKDSDHRAAAWLVEIPASNFFKPDEETWSPSDNLDHMIKAVKPITRALKLPRITLHAMFGKPGKASISYEQLCQRYRDEITRGGQASGRYLPEQKSPVEDIGEEKSKLLGEWANASSELVSAAEKWDNNDLDRYQLPHPLLGKLTVREMLYFAIYHNLRHASQEGD
jgi:uncharacterized damage-inducible protein DinB